MSMMMILIFSKCMIKCLWSYVHLEHGILDPYALKVVKCSQVHQSLNWQHQLCKNPKPNQDIKTLFVDHRCGQPNGARAPSHVTNPLMGGVLKAGGFPPLGAHGPADSEHVLKRPRLDCQMKYCSYLI